MFASCCFSTFSGKPSCDSAPDAVPIIDDCVRPPAARPDAVPGSSANTRANIEHDDEAGAAEHERHGHLRQRPDAQGGKELGPRPVADREHEQAEEDDPCSSDGNVKVPSCPIRTATIRMQAVVPIEKPRISARPENGADARPPAAGRFPERWRSST